MRLATLIFITTVFISCDSIEKNLEAYLEEHLDETEGLEIVTYKVYDTSTYISELNGRIKFLETSIIEPKPSLIDSIFYFLKSNNINLPANPEVLKDEMLKHEKLRIDIYNFLMFEDKKNWPNKYSDFIILVGLEDSPGRFELEQKKKERDSILNDNSINENWVNSYDITFKFRVGNVGHRQLYLCRATLSRELEVRYCKCNKDRTLNRK